MHSISLLWHVFISSAPSTYYSLFNCIIVTSSPPTQGKNKACKMELVTFWYRMWKILVGKSWRIWRIVSHSPKSSWPIFTDTRKTYMVYALTVTYLSNFFVANNFYLHGSPKFSPAKYFLCTVVSQLVSHYSQCILCG